MLVSEGGQGKKKVRDQKAWDKMGDHVTGLRDRDRIRFRLRIRVKVMVWVMVKVRIENERGKTV